eukprot:4741348-Prymnesium_polylepis.1
MWHVCAGGRIRVGLYRCGRRLGRINWSTVFSARCGSAHQSSSSTRRALAQCACRAGACVAGARCATSGGGGVRGERT